jgi:hypothetical protein
MNRQLTANTKHGQFYPRLYHSTKRKGRQFYQNCRPFMVDLKDDHGILFLRGKKRIKVFTGLRTGEYTRRRRVRFLFDPLQAKE